MVFLRYFSYLFFSFLLTFLLTFFIYFEDIRNSKANEFEKQNYNNFIYLKELLKNTTLDNDFVKIDSSIKTFLNLDSFDDIELNYKKYFFSKKAIVVNSNKINNIHYKFSDVSTDYKYGKIIQLDETIYEFIPNVSFDTTKPVVIKFQAYNDGDVYNSTSTLQFYKKISDNTQSISNDSWLYNLMKFDDMKTDKQFTIEYEKNPYVDVSYTINKNDLVESSVVFVKKIFFYSLSLFLITLMILYLFYIKVFKKDIEKPISQIEEYLTEILNNKYIRLNKVDTKVMHIDKIFEKLHKLSKKIASQSNQLNVHRELLSRKDFIDDITGLSNKKVFEKDIKSMFIDNRDGYIVLGKINNLGQFANTYGSNDANNLIKDFGHGILQLLKRYTQVNSKVYRFYGAEFAMIIESSELDNLKKIISELSDSLEDQLKSKYLIDGDPFYFGATPFDNYGTIDTILHSAHETLLKCTQTDIDLYRISDNAELIEKTKKMEVIVADIIEREDFAVKFIYDTFEMDNDNKLLLQDASPVIMDSNTFELFPIGMFIAVAEKLNLSAVFDRILIEKVLVYLENEKLEHKIGINLSMKSLTDKKFLAWIEGTLLYNENAKKSLIFSVTSYNAKVHLENFKSLIEIIHKFDSKIMLKRFMLDDFTLDELSELEIDYLRLNKDYCSNIDADRTKKHAVKNIILYGEMNDVFILGDFVKSDEDYKTLSRLGLYATSR